MMPRRLSIGVLVVCAVIVTVTPESLVGYVAGGSAAVGLLVGLWIGALRPSPGGRLPWLLIAAGLSLWLFVDIGLDPFGVGEILWLAGYPIFNASFVIMVMRRARRQASAGLLDGLTLATAATLTVWQVLIRPQLGDTPTVGEVLLNASYLLGNFITLAALLFLVLSPGRRGVPTRLLVMSTSTALTLELLLHITAEWASFLDGRLAGVGLLAYGMCVAAMLRHDRDELVSPAPVAVETLHPARVLFLGLALLAVPLLAVTQGGLDLGDRILLIVGTVVTTALSLIRFVGAVREQARVQFALAYQADHDTLTGLANRRAFTNRLHQHRSTGSLTVIYLDLDRFKPINDSYGHAAGDAVLVAVAERLRNSIRAGDLAARLGGDEFAVLCADLEPAGLHRLTDRLAAVIAEPIDVDGQRVSVGASIGVASTRDGVEPQTLIAEADHAMFDAKHSDHRQLVAPRT